MARSLSRGEVLERCSSAVRAKNPQLFTSAVPVPVAPPMLTSPPRRRRRPRPRLNKTEQRYALLLEARRRADEILDYRFEAITLRLGDDCRYTPDFVVITTTGLELHEVKGAHVREDARVKFLAAVEQFPFFQFSWAQWADGKWSIRRHTPTTTIAR